MLVLDKMKEVEVKQGSVTSSGVSWHLRQHWTYGAAAKVGGPWARNA